MFIYKITTTNLYVYMIIAIREKHFCLFKMLIWMLSCYGWYMTVLLPVNNWEGSFQSKNLLLSILCLKKRVLYNIWVVIKKKKIRRAVRRGNQYNVCMYNVRFIKVTCHILIYRWCGCDERTLNQVFSGVDYCMSMVHLCYDLILNSTLEVEAIHEKKNWWG